MDQPAPYSVGGGGEEEEAEEAEAASSIGPPSPSARRSTKACSTTMAQRGPCARGWWVEEWRESARETREEAAGAHVRKGDTTNRRSERRLRVARGVKRARALERGGGMAWLMCFRTWKAEWK